MMEPLEKLSTLPEPYEVLDMLPGEIQELTIEGWEMGKIFIRPAYAPEGKWIPGLRVLVPKETKPAGLPYFDITSKTLQTQLLSALGPVIVTPRRVRITKYGRAPHARFMLEVIG